MPATLTRTSFLNKNIQPLFDAFEQAEAIVVFHHVSPDPDARGTQLGMCEFLKERYPGKTILAAGPQDDMDEVSDEQMKSAMALICDTSNGYRVDDQRYTMCRNIARIDHHIQVEDFGELDYVDADAPAAAEVAVEILRAHGEEIPASSAQHFLEALISDTQRFMLPSVRPSTFEAAAWLVSHGASVDLAQKHLYTRIREKYAYGGKVISKSVLKNKCLVAVMSRDDYLSCACPFEEAKNSVNLMAQIEGVEIWVLITQNLDGQHYQASVRSAGIVVEPLARAYGGGGHACACGIKNLDASTVSALIDDLAKLSLTQEA